MLTLRPTDFQPNVRLGKLAQALAPSHSFCGRCGTPWPFVKRHATQYSDSRGCFPLCQFCWEECSPEERLPYYRELFESWVSEGAEIATPELWLLIHSAVLAGQ